jgi:SRSO17 transposase
MMGASIETTLELWASSLREVKKRIRPLFAQERAALNAGLFVDGLLGDERRKTGWMRAEAAGDPGPWRQQAVLGRDRWAWVERKRCADPEDLKRFIRRSRCRNG